MIKKELLAQLSDARRNQIAELENRVKDGILEETNAEFLERLIVKADTDEEAGKIAGLGTTYKKTGFHFDMRLDKIIENTGVIKYLKRDNELSFGEAAEGEPVHKLIIGDNYDALQNLLIEYRGHVDVIYIDPPYGKDSMGEYAETNYNNAISRDNLLSMLFFRLQLAKQLLSENGVIFCSIDDRNMAYVKCLFDDVFTEGSFICTLVIESSVIAGPRRVPAMLGSIVKTAEFCLVYCLSRDKKIIKNLKFDPIAGFDTHYKDWLDETKGQTISLVRLMESDEVMSDLFDKYHLDVSLQNMATLLEVSQEAKDWLYSDKIAKYLFRKGGRASLDNEEKMPPYKLLKIDNNWYIKTSEGVFNVFRYIDRIGVSDDYFKKFGERQVRGNLWKGFSSDGGNLEKEGGVSYKGGKKPKRLIRQLIDSVSNNPNAIILDFFAGSGTTGHAVLELNRVDEGKRTFLLCQSNDIIQGAPNGIATDITSKRMKRIMTGTCYDGSCNKNWLDDNKPYGGRLEVYNIAEVKNNETTEGQTPFDVIDETLYGRPKFDTMREKIEWVCNNFERTQRQVPGIEI